MDATTPFFLNPASKARSIAQRVGRVGLHIDDKDLPPDVLRLSLGSTQKLWVVDGQHRRRGFDRVFAPPGTGHPC
jgi:hypothetical protein